MEIERQDEMGWDKRSRSQTADCTCEPPFDADVDTDSDTAAEKADARLAIVLVWCGSLLSPFSPQEIYIILTCYTRIRCKGWIPDTHGPVFMEISHQGVDNRVDVHRAFPHIIKNHGGEREGSTEHAAEGPSLIYLSKKTVLENWLFGWAALHVGS